MKVRKRIAVVAGLSDEKFISKAKPLFLSDRVEHIYLFRFAGNPISEAASKTTTFDKAACSLRRLYDLAVCFHILTLALARKIDVLVGFYFYPHGVIAGLLGRLSQIPVIQILTGTDLADFCKKGMFHTTLARAAAIGVRGKASESQLRSVGLQQTRAFVLSNFFDWHEPQAGTRGKNRAFDLIFVGYLRKLKRLDILIRAVAKLKLDFPAITCAVVGDGPEKKAIKSLIEDLELVDNIRLLGYSSRISELLANSSIFIMTSDSEGLPMAIIEAMSAGVPVVVPDINDISTIVTHGKDGFLVNEQSSTAYCNACKKLLADTRLQKDMGGNALQKMRNLHNTSFSFDAVQGVWEGILEEITSGANIRTV